MTNGQIQQPTAEMRELGSATHNRALAGYLARANVDSWVDLLLNYCAQRALTKGLMSILEEVCSSIPSASALLHCFHPHLGCRY